MPPLQLIVLLACRWCQYRCTSLVFCSTLLIFWIRCCISTFQMKTHRSSLELLCFSRSAPTSPCSTLHRPDAVMPGIMTRFSCSSQLVDDCIEYGLFFYPTCVLSSSCDRPDLRENWYSHLSPWLLALASRFLSEARWEAHYLRFLATILLCFGFTSQIVAFRILPLFPCKLVGFAVVASDILSRRLVYSADCD